MTRIPPIVALAFLAIVGCTSAAPTVVPTTASPAASATESGRLTAVDAGTRTLTYRLSEILSGDAATAAARQDGKIGPNEDLPTPQYIRDLGRDQRRVLASSAKVQVLKPDTGGDPVLTTIQPDAYLAALAAEFLPDDWYGSPYYSFQVGADGQVNAVEHLYTP